MRTFLKRVTLLATVAIPALGCGCSETPRFDPQSSYTPEAIAPELTFRFGALTADAKKVTHGKPLKPATPLKGEVMTKAAEATKNAPAQTADALIEDAARQIRSLPGGSPAAACRKVAEAVRKDTSLPAAEKDDLARRLDELAAQL